MEVRNERDSSNPRGGGCRQETLRRPGAVVRRVPGLRRRVGRTNRSLENAIASGQSNAVMQLPGTTALEQSLAPVHRADRAPILARRLEPGGTSPSVAPVTCHSRISLQKRSRQDFLISTASLFFVSSSRTHIESTAERGDIVSTQHLFGT